MLKESWQSRSSWWPWNDEKFFAGVGNWMSSDEMAHPVDKVPLCLFQFDLLSLEWAETNWKSIRSSTQIDIGIRSARIRRRTTRLPSLRDEEHTWENQLFPFFSLSFFFRSVSIKGIDEEHTTELLSFGDNFSNGEIMCDRIPRVRFTCELSSCFRLELADRTNPIKSSAFPFSAELIV